MRIFCAVRHSTDPSRFYGGLWSRNFNPALQRLGHEIVESRVDLLPASRFMAIHGRFTPEELAVRGEITQQILEELRMAHAREPVGLFLSYFYNAHFDPAGFAEIRRLGIPSINFYCNSIPQFELVNEIAPAVDHSWHPERDARDSYLAAGARPVWVQMGADPDLYKPLAGRGRQSAACFVGQRYADRDRLAFAAISAGIPLDLYGNGWGNSPAVQEEDQGRYYLGRYQPAPGSAKSYLRAVAQVVDAEGLRAPIALWRRWVTRRHSTVARSAVAKAARGAAHSVSETFAAYEVVLNFSNVWGAIGKALIPHVRLRDFEAPMCRACYVTGYSPEIEEFYSVGQEIDVYKTPAELVDKVRFYLANPAAAEKLRAAGYRRALDEHTWVHRFRQLFAKTGLSGRAVTTA